MPELTWLGKDAIRHHHLEVPYRPFVPTATFEAPGTAPDAPLHRIIHGDNLDALKSLLPEFEGRVKCIYIDPPYNTGNEQWAYNDNVNDPRLLAWLGRTVGKEAEDLSRHDKWLCMMYPRLQLLHKLLSEDGAIFISIDDNEVGHLRVVMDEIFGAKNMLACFAWKTDGNFDNQAKIKINHEYILAFCKRATMFAAPQVIDPATAISSKLFNEEIKNTLIKNGIKNPVTPITLPIGFPTNFEKGGLGKRRTVCSTPQKLDRLSGLA